MSHFHTVLLTCLKKMSAVLIRLQMKPRQANHHPSCEILKLLFWSSAFKDASHVLEWPKVVNLNCIAENNRSKPISIGS